MRRQRASWAGRLASWARDREAEVEALGFSPQRASLLRARVPFHLAFRVALRLGLAMGPFCSRRRRAAVGACLGWDVLQAVRLRRDPCLRLGPRLVADLVDVAAWSAANDGASVAVPILGVPLVTETALRYQWAALPVPALHALGATLARRLAGKPPQLMHMGNQVLALLFGLGLRRVERVGAERVRDSFEAECSAIEATATVAGEYRVAAGTYVVAGERVNPHDVLSGIRLHFPGARRERGALHELAWGGRKGALESLAARQAVQLDTALRAWKRDVNARRSALAHQILDPALPEGHGMTLLSGDQVGRLVAALDAMELGGSFAVNVLEATRPGARVVLAVNGTRTVLPPDPPRLVVVRPDPTPVALLEGGVAWALLEATEAADRAPLWSVVPGAVAYAALAFWSRRALRARGEAAYEAVVSLSAAAALVQGLVVHVAIDGAPDRPDGTQRFPMQAALNAPAVLAGFCWPWLGRDGRRRIALTFAALVVLGIVLLEPPHRWRDLTRNAVWLPALFLPSLAYSRAGQREAESAQHDLLARQTRAADEAACRGERREWERVRAACVEALACLDSVSPAARPEVERRLTELHRLTEEHLHA